MQENIRRDYINMRNSGNFDLNVFWRMYENEGGILKSSQEFAKYFLNEVQPLGNGLEIKTSRDRDQILISIDKKLELTGLYDVNGNFLKIVN